MRSKGNTFENTTKPQEIQLLYKESRGGKCQERGCNNTFTTGTLFKGTGCACCT